MEIICVSKLLKDILQTMLDMNEPLTSSEVANLLHADRQTVSTMLSWLYRGGGVVKRAGTKPFKYTILNLRQAKKIMARPTRKTMPKSSGSPQLDSTKPDLIKLDSIQLPGLTTHKALEEHYREQPTADEIISAIFRKIEEVMEENKLLTEENQQLRVLAGKNQSKPVTLPPYITTSLVRHGD